jgi:hypothetical protein
MSRQLALRFDKIGLLGVKYHKVALIYFHRTILQWLFNPILFDDHLHECLKEDITSVLVSSTTLYSLNDGFVMSPGSHNICEIC